MDVEAEISGVRDALANILGTRSAMRGVMCACLHAGSFALICTTGEVKPDVCSKANWSNMKIKDKNRKHVNIPASL